MPRAEARLRGWAGRTAVERYGAGRAAMRVQGLPPTAVGRQKRRRCARPTSPPMCSRIGWPISLRVAELAEPRSASLWRIGGDRLISLQLWTLLIRLAGTRPMS